MTTPTPISALNASDPGDETAKKYRYQYAYGCIIWIAAFRAEKDYKALWCEQHEDFLGQVSDTCFDAYQIKTRRAEIGDWQWNHDALVNTVKRFVLLDRDFPGKIRHFYFVSNAQCSASEAEATNHLSPVPVLKCLALTYGPYPEFCEKCLTTLSEKTSCHRHEICTVLQRMQISLGPPEEAFEAEIKQHHIPNINGCASLAPYQLNDLLDILVGCIWRASSRGSRSPSRHYAIINGRFDQEPQLHEKRIEVAALQTFLDGLLWPRFEYLARFKTVKLAANRDETSILHQKVVGGGLEDYYESLRRQTLSAERRLLELQDCRVFQSMTSKAG
jgi:hypothetical protein